LGRMGRPMASNLCRKGFSLVVFDINPEPVRALAGAGARPADSIAAVASSSDIVFTMLPDSASVEVVIGGRDGVVANGRAGSMLVEMSTIDPRVTDHVAAVA